MVDTLKSIHFHTSSTVDPNWSTGVGENGQHDLKTLCTALMLEGRTLPPNLSLEDYLLVLLVLLTTINILQCSLGPLTTAAISVRQQSIIVSGPTPSVLPNPLDQRTTPLSPETTQSNPHVPFTTDREYNNLRARLSDSLVTWQKSFATRDPRPLDTVQDPLSETCSMMTLLYLARILLDGGPAMYVVPSLAGYTAEPYETLPSSVPRPCSPHKIGISFSDEAVQAAVKILESVEEAQNGSSVADDAATQDAAVCPMWYPLALFYGALVVWGRLEEDEEHAKIARKISSNRPLIATRRTLRGFYTALRAIEHDWDCASHMATVVKSLFK